MRSMIEFQLDAGSGVATDLQLVQQVHDALRLGLLEPGDATRARRPGLEVAP
jgi:GntR family transcriptional regulator